MRIVILLAMFAQVSRTPPREVEFKPGRPVEQPVPFSHRVHVSNGLKCLECHAIEAPGDYAGFPAESKCMACHIAIQADSPHIRKIAAARKSGQAMAWKRVYKVKEFVYFSHEIHVRKAKADCSACHGEVASRDVLFVEKSISMYACMRCHDQYKAPNDCSRCHDTQ